MRSANDRKDLDPLLEQRLSELPSLLLFSHLDLGLVAAFAGAAEEEEEGGELFRSPSSNSSIDLSAIKSYRGLKGGE